MKQRKKSLLIIMVIVVMVVAVLFVVMNYEGTRDKGVEYTEYSGFSPEYSYAAYLEKYAQEKMADCEVNIPVAEYATSDGEVQFYEEYEGKNNIILTKEEGYVEWNITVPQTGFYQIEAEYLTYGGNGLKVERTMYIDGELPYNEAEFLTFERSFVDVESEPAVDLDGHDIRPKQVEQYIWQKKMLVDASGYYDEPLKFYLTEGEHTLGMKAEREPLMLAAIRLCQTKEAPNYEEYKAQHKEHEGEQGELRIIQAEDMHQKSEKSNYPINDRTSPYTQPQNAYAILLNSMGGTRWQKVGSSVSWVVSVEKSGFYKIAPRYKQDYVTGMKVYRTLLIDGELPFKEAANLEFHYDNQWQCSALGNETEEFLFYFEADREYVLEMEVTLGNMDNILRRTEAVLQELNDIYKEILMVTGASPDKYRDYSFDKSIPDTLKKLAVQAEELAEIKEEFERVNEGSGERVAQLTKMEYLVRRMAEDPDEIAGKFNTFQDNLSALGTWITDMSNQPLSFDYIALVPEKEVLPKAEGNIFENLLFQCKLFGSSFL